MPHDPEVVTDEDRLGSSDRRSSANRLSTCACTDTSVGAATDSSQTSNLALPPARAMPIPRPLPARKFDVGSDRVLIHPVPPAAAGSGRVPHARRRHQAVRNCGLTDLIDYPHAGSATRKDPERSSAAQGACDRADHWRPPERRCRRCRPKTRRFHCWPASGLQ